MSKPPTPPPGYSQHAQLSRLLSRSHNGLADLMDRELAAYGLTFAQYAVWSILASGRAETATEICKEISYDPGAMTRMLDRLEQKNLLRRIHNPENRRTLKLELTDQGRAAYPEAQRRIAAVMAGVLGGFTAEELDQLADLLARMADRFADSPGTLMAGTPAGSSSQGRPAGKPHGGTPRP